MPHQKGIKPVAQNKKAYHEYFVEETYECGLCLKGTEVKSMRQGKPERELCHHPFRRGICRGNAH